MRRTLPQGPESRGRNDRSQVPAERIPIGFLPSTNRMECPV